NYSSARFYHMQLRDSRFQNRLRARGPSPKITARRVIPEPVEGENPITENNCETRDSRTG
ncbi:hypothetical protein KKD49_02655, partial [Myxococcota bacterium]|nr:hypothetical protein [Myxococcota bacterium]